MATVATLTFDLIANSAKLRTDLQKASRSTQQWAAKTKQIVGTASKAFAGLAVASAAGLAAMAASAARSNLELINSAQIANESVASFSAMSFAAKQYGIEQGKLSDILKDTQDRVGDFLATGGGPMADFFENVAPKINLTKDAFVGLSGSQALQLYYDSLQKANVSQEEMVFYLEAMASDTTALIPLLKDGGKGFRELSAEADDLGLLLSDLDAEKIKDMNKAFTRSNLVLDGFQTRLAVELAPLVTALTDQFMDAAREAGGMGKLATKAVKYMVDGFGKVLDIGRYLQLGFKTIQFALQGIGTAAISSFAFIYKGYVELANLIPGIDIDYESTFIGELEKLAKEGLERTGKELNALGLEKLPSVEIQEWVDDVIDKTNKAAKDKVAQDPDKGLGKTILGQAANDETDYTKNLVTFEETMARYRSVAENTSAYVEDAFVRAGDAMVTNFSNAAAQAIVQGKSMDEVWSSVAKTLATSVISSLIQIGVQMAINKAFATSSTAASVAEAAVAGPAIASAFAPAAAAVSLATLGANSIPATAGISSTYALTSGLALTGIAHEGISNVPREGTWLLDKGERVIPDDQNERITRALENGAGAANDGGVHITNVFQISGGDPGGNRRALMAAMPEIEARIVKSVEGQLGKGRSMSRAAGVR